MAKKRFSEFSAKNKFCPKRFNNDTMIPPAVLSRALLGITRCGGAMSEYTISSVKDSRGVRAGDSSLAIARWREILSVERIPQYKPYAGDFVTVVLY